MVWRGVANGLTRRELVEGRDEMLATHQWVARSFIDLRFDIGEVDACERFRDMEVAGFAICVSAIPIEDAVGGIGILLNFMDEKSRADGVEASRFDE